MRDSCKNLDGGGGTPAFQRVAILGLGLMGGSLGLALKRLQENLVVCGYARRAATRDLALTVGACDAVFDTPRAAVEGADLVVLCTPILDMPALAEGIRDSLAGHAIVTDVGSTKAMLMEQMGAALSGTEACFVGSHPMAGSERTGMEAARADLYEHAVVIVTPPAGGSGDDAAERLAALWRAIGAHVVMMGAPEHDAIVAGTSHVPHLLAALLVRAAARTTAAPGPYCGPGFRDATRIAGGSENVWHDIVKSNAEPIERCLKSLRSDLDEWIQLLEAGDFETLRRLLGEARMERGRILARDQ